MARDLLDCSGEIASGVISDIGLSVIISVVYARRFLIALARLLQFDIVICAL